jgi:TolA-binding protein
MRIWDSEMKPYRAALVVLVLAAFASCAYYNIYWMAREEYDKVVSRPDFQGFWDPYNHRKVTGENSKLAESCIKRCGKLILLYPESKWVDDALLLMGNCFLLRGDYANAAKKYDELLRLYATSDLRYEARYMKAYSLVLLDAIPKAVTELDELLGGVTERTVREKATYLRARLSHAAGDCEEAVGYLDKYVSTFPNGPRVSEVRLSLGGCLIRTGRRDEAVEVLRPLYQRPGDQGADAGLQMGRAYRGLGQNDKAFEIFERLAAETPTDTLKAKAIIEIANTLLGESSPDEAIKRLVEADSLLADEHGNLKSEIKYRIGNIYEKHILDFDMATESYEAASKSKSKYGKLATKRSNALKDLKRYGEALTDTIPDTPDERAMKMFLMAEIYLEDLELTEKGFDQLMVVADSFPASKFAAKSMLTIGSLLDARQDTTGLIYYRRVMEDFPGTVYENVARSRLSLPLVDIVVEAPAPAVAADTAAASEIPQVPAAADTLGPAAPADTVGPTVRVSPEKLGPPAAEPDTSGAAEGVEFEPLVRDTTGLTEPPRLGIRRPEPEPRESLQAGQEESISDTLGLPAHQDTVGKPTPEGQNR